MKLLFLGRTVGLKIRRDDGCWRAPDRAKFELKQSKTVNRRIEMTYRNKNLWSVILGGSSGIGLASAKKLAREGMNLIVVHRDRRGSMEKINKEFDEIRETGVKFEAINANALSEEGRQEIVTRIADSIGDGRIKMMLHSIALGNLKLFVPENAAAKSASINPIEKLAKSLNLETSELQSKVDGLFESGLTELVDLATTPEYSNELIAAEEDISQTVYNMGTSLLFWVQDIHKRGMFDDDARILGLTSEGNDLAWKSYGAVSAAKCALESISRSIATEFAQHGLRCNILQPGVTDTPALRLIPGSQQMKARAMIKNPFNRLTTPEDVANVVELMCRKESAWINGTVIRVDGGEHISG